ncbi:MAG: hypothetical protein AAF449_10170, partial [Myxococcota bacterium]
MREPLARLCQRMKGSMAASVIDPEGAVLSSVRIEDSSADIEELWNDYVGLLSQVRGSAQMLAAGALEELLLTSDQVTTVVRPLGSKAFLVLGIRPDASQGRARYLCRVTAPQLAAQL